MANKEGDASFPAGHDFLEFYAAEVDRQVQAEQQFTTALSTRASLLITATGLLALAKPGAISASVIALDFHFFSVLLGIFAGIAGVRVLFLSPARGLDLKKFWNRYSRCDADTATAAAVARKVEDLEARRKVNARKTSWIRAGFIMMLGAIGSAAISFVATL